MSEGNEIKTKRVIWGRVLCFDVMNVLAILAVLFLHHNGIVHHFTDTMAWREALAVECFAYWAVPVFLMLSGANLLDYPKRYTTKVFFRKRIEKTVVPWLFWSVLVLAGKLVTGQIENGNVLDLLNLILRCKVEPRYWFFLALFGLYLSFPVLAALAQKRNVLWYIAAVDFICTGCFPVINKLTGLNLNLAVPAACGLAVYPVLGYLLSTMRLAKAARFKLYLAGFMAALFRYGYTYAMSVETGTTNTAIKGYSTFHAVLLAAAVFVFLKEIPWESLLSERQKAVLQELSSYSFGIFLIHTIVMNLEMKWFRFGADSFLWRIAWVPVTYLFSLALCVLIGKIPVLRRTIGK